MKYFKQKVLFSNKYCHDQNTIFKFYIKSTFNYYFIKKINLEQAELQYKKWLTLKGIQDENDILTNTKYNRFISNMEFSEIIFSFYGHGQDPQEDIKYNVLMQLDFIYTNLNKLLIEKMSESKLLLKQNPQTIIELLEKFYQYFDEKIVGYIKKEKLIFLYFSLVEANLLKKPLNNKQIQSQLMNLSQEFQEYEGKISMRYFKLFFYNKRLISQNIVFELIKSVEKQILFFIPFKQKANQIIDNLNHQQQSRSNSQMQFRQSINKGDQSHFIRNQTGQNHFQQNEDQKFQNIAQNNIHQNANNQNQNQMEYNTDFLQQFPSIFDLSFCKAYQLVQERQNIEDLQNILNQSPIAKSIYYCLNDNYSAIMYWIKTNDIQVTDKQLKSQIYSIYKQNYMATFLNVEGQFPKTYQQFVNSIIFNFIQLYQNFEKEIIQYYLTGGFLNIQTPTHSQADQYLLDNLNKNNINQMKQNKSRSSSPQNFNKISPQNRGSQTYQQEHYKRFSQSDTKNNQTNINQFRYSIKNHTLKNFTNPTEQKESMTYRESTQYSPVRDYINHNRQTTKIDPKQLNLKLKLKYKEQYIYQKLDKSKSSEKIKKTSSSININQVQASHRVNSNSPSSNFQYSNNGVSNIKSILNSHRRINHLSSYQQTQTNVSPYRQATNLKNQFVQVAPFNNQNQTQSYNIYNQENNFPIQNYQDKNQNQFGSNYYNFLEQQNNQIIKVDSDLQYSNFTNEYYNFSFSPQKGQQDQQIQTFNSFQ
ncbi:hypothetical protein TTHERM_00112960 (macronuclear) [Tetrahymena thermophila SB210]|uniref:Uncharacterized protein n=1 Tax=Tetrahymena thermophila (strain SB210) TaxID=312017 RepID=Q22Z75_TETTS|nr:hypothetical protein TTHERM_00112960 [Tetrahymena thermophila SB210]EAR90446.2 hypothetical protein TTHERM_00112960 [Tetrahymena thermophila SB210]|eukprot:XP_001010691.2 hypothetical protein TTHERM_00112960 [Tetrahymena thermophila SB210]